MKKELRAWLIILALNMVMLIPYAYDYTHREPSEDEWIEETEDVIRWRFDEEDVSIEELEVEVVEQAPLFTLGEFKLTAYCPCKLCCNKDDGIPATGTQATQGRTVAVDPSVIPYGTVLIINGHEYIAEDCGGAIKGNKIDIFFNSHEEALDFGVQYAEVFVKAVE